jgi:phage gp46-like protein
MAAENPSRTQGALRLRFDTASLVFDLAVDEDAQRFETDDGLETAVAISLFTDRRASDADLKLASLPLGAAANAGWPGDTYSEVPGDEWGSHLWLLKRAPRNDDTLERAAQYAEEALAWLIEDAVATAVEAVARWVGTTGYLELDITITRPGSAEPRWRRVWNATTGEMLTDAD